MTEREGEGIQEMVEEKKKEMIDEIEERAKRVREVDVRRYWRGKEEERKARRGMNFFLLFFPPLPASLFSTIGTYPRCLFTMEN